MIKRAPSRNTRTRGFKVKHVLQICLLLGVCFWLIYQVKHSHDKKKEFDENEGKISDKTEIGVGIRNLGRKGLHPHVQELPKDGKHEEDDDEETTVDEVVNKMEENKREQKQVEDETKRVEEREEEASKHEEGEQEEGSKYEEGEQEEGSKHEEEEEQEERSKHEEGEQEEGSKHEEEEEQEERSKHEEEEIEEGNKHEDEEQEEESKSDEIEDERRGGGDDEIDEHDQEKIGEADREEDLVDEEREREEEGEEKESGNDGAEDKEAQMGHETSAEDQDHDGGNDHEAREEQYKADDASSAVTHDTQTITTIAEKISYENSNETSTTNDLELEKTSNNIDTNDVNGDKRTSKSQFGEVATAYNDPPPNATATEKKDDENTNTEDPSTKHAAFISVSSDQPVISNTSIDVNVEAGNNPVGGNTETSGSTQHNGTMVTSDLNQVQNATIDHVSTGEASSLRTTVLVQVNSSMVSGNIETNSNSSISDKTENRDINAPHSNSSTILEPAGSDKVIKSEVAAEAEVKPDGPDKNIKPEFEVEEAKVNSGSSSTAKENTGDANESGGTEENSGSSATDGTEAVFPDHIDSSIGQEEKEARIDLDTLPGNSGEGVHSRDAAAE